MEKSIVIGTVFSLEVFRFVVVIQIIDCVDHFISIRPMNSLGGEKKVGSQLSCIEGRQKSLL